MSTHQLTNVAPAGLQADHKPGGISQHGVSDGGGGSAAVSIGPRARGVPVNTQAPQGISGYKLYTVYRHQPEVPRSTFAAGLIRRAERQLEGDQSWIGRVVDIADRRPEDCGWPQAPGYPAFAAAEEFWFAHEENLHAHLRGFESPDGVTDVWHYVVDEHIRKDCRPALVAGARTPGVKQLFYLTRPAEKSRDAFVGHWRDVHAPLAMRSHVGMWKYVQNVVVESFPSSAPAFDGIAELHYPTLADARTRRYDSPADRDAIAADRPNFVGASIGIFSGEYSFCR